MLFQISCKKEVDDQTTKGKGLTQLNVIVYDKDISNSVNSSVSETWLANTDGSNQRQVATNLPGADCYGPRLTPDGKK